ILEILECQGSPLYTPISTQPPQPDFEEPPAVRYQHDLYKPLFSDCFGGAFFLPLWQKKCPLTTEMGMSQSYKAN
uniref:Uncharacterized protein n=1 Tax=Neovison vison TaxID=452646 RepID=A0A8C7AZW4_NEOVI